MVRSGLAVLVVSVALVVAQVAALGAQNAAPKLSDERLVSAKGMAGTSSKCKAASGSFTFTTSGHAAGPYAGTFTATGTVSVSKYAVTRYSATIKIASKSGMVTISESLAKSASDKGFCLPGRGLVGFSASYSAAVVSGGHTTKQKGTSAGAVTGGSAKSSGLRLIFS
jgi:hypothetical protein